MGELLDTIPPKTNAELTGDKGTGKWCRSDVLVTLTAKDNPEGKGVSYSVYSLDGKNWNKYEIPLEFKDEDTYKIYFLSHDNVDNQEDIKSVEFSIDKTIPEAKVFIDLDQFDLNVEGIDLNPIAVSREDNPETGKKDDTVYTITDLAGNTLTLDVRDRDKNNKDSFKVYSLKYHEDPPVILDQNQFNVSYKGKKERLNIEEQRFKVKDEVKIKIKYDFKKDESTIFTKEEGLEKIKEIKNGLSLLWLKTDKGKLEYSY